MPGNTLKALNALNALNARNTLNALNALMPGLDALAQLPGWSRQPVCPATRLVLGNLFAWLTFYPAPTWLFRVARDGILGGSPDCSLWHLYWRRTAPLSGMEWYAPLKTIVQ